ncbi:MAG: hypothetical protein A2V88_16945 [Elusimicrobia bacterium RBG_16_66_12]|nr:MAG: hypothetical protein A2V88_16945 [Elusimicrobia bacterium RBG_16_66_12]
METFKTKHGTLIAGEEGIVFDTGVDRGGYIRGMTVPPYLVELPPEKINPREIICIKNAEVRREFVRKVGIERIVAALNATVVDKSGDYELLLLDIGEGSPRPYLRMRNPSVPGVWHIEGVHPNVRTVAEALAWRNMRPDPPNELT